MFLLCSFPNWALFRLELGKCHSIRGEGHVHLPLCSIKLIKKPRASGTLPSALAIWVFSWFGNVFICIGMILVTNCKKLLHILHSDREESLRNTYKGPMDKGKGGVGWRVGRGKWRQENGDTCT